MSTTKVIISGGGTGGHIYPAVAIANALKAADPSVEILFVGALGRMEMQKVPAAGYNIVGLPISGIQRSLSLSNLSFPVKVLKSLLKARTLIKEFKPQIAIGVGGYASFPLLYAASKMGITTMLQEQNSYAGVANKFLSRSAAKVCVAYEGMEKYFPSDKIVLTGNPVRKDILETSSLREKGLAHFGLSGQKKSILVIGGSLGARTINESIVNGLLEFEKAGVQLLWQTGKTFYESRREEIKRMQSSSVKIHEFIYEMNLAYACADIVISRAGALSISELCVVGKPVILVPSPNVAEDHQTKNALALSSREAAVLVKDADARQNLVSDALLLLNDSARKQKYSANILKMGRSDAANDIARIIFGLVSKSNVQ